MSVNLIWDIDGTLVDSYDLIVDCIFEVLNHYNISYDRQFVREMIQRQSSSHFFKYVVKEHSEIDYEEIWKIYNSTFSDVSKIKLMPNVKETLEGLKQRGVKNYIFTHRGHNVFDTIKALNIEEYFVEVVNIENGFKRKPEPDALNYLIDKYQMNKKDAYYVGDRLIDQECAKNAGIGRIYYQSYMGFDLDSKDYDYKVIDLLDILKLDIY